MRGSRVQGIIRELRGEKIDIVDWAEDLHQYAINALKPAKVNSVTEIMRANDDGFEEPHLEVIVAEDQLSLAIGKRGQNVRLAGKLLSRKIDVMSKEQKEALAAEKEAAAAEPEETSEEVAAEAPAETPVVAAAGDDDLEGLAGVGPKAAEALRQAGYGSTAAIAAAGADALLAVAGIGPKSAAKIWEQVVAADSGGDAEPQAEGDPGPAAADEPQEPVATDI